MSTLDIVLAGVLFLFFIIGFVKGIIRTIVHLAALILTVYMILNSGQFVKYELMNYFSLNPTVSTILAYFVMILIIILIAKFVNMILDKLVEIFQLKFINRLLGGLFGIFNGALLIAIFLVFLEFLPVQEEFYQITKDSYIINYVKNAKDSINLDVKKSEKAKTKLETKSEKIMKQVSEKAKEHREKVEEFIEEHLEK